MPQTMRAIRKLEPAPGLTLTEVPVPQIGPEEVLVQVEAASLCGTDLAGRSIAVLGCGPIGLFTIGIARASGAAAVFAADRTAFRLDLARRMGATAVVDVGAVEDAAAWFREQNEGYGLDIVFEMSG